MPINAFPSANGLLPDVALHAPDLYTAASGLPLNQPQVNHVNQIASTVGLNQQLMNMSIKDAQNRFSTLDPQIQTQLKSFYGEASYMATPQKNIVIRGLGDVVGAVASPFKWVFKNVVNDYSKAINMPYLLGREMESNLAENKNPFSWNLVRSAWDGTEVYDNQSLAQLHKQYGDTDSFVAMKTLAGMTPGKIIEAYGTVNGNIIGSIAKMLDKPKEFNDMLNNFKAAQISPGRDLARIMFSSQPVDNKLHSGLGFRLLSGTLDAAYEIMHDPLTWITGGTSRAVTASEKLAEQLANKTLTVEDAFKRTDIRNTWDNVAGPLIEKIANARTAKNPEAAASAINQLKQQLPAMSNDNIITELAKAKVFNADQAKEFFDAPLNMTKLLAGSMDTTTYFRNGVPIAKRTNALSSYVNATANRIFNGTATEEEKSTLFSKLVGDVKNIGSDRSPLFNEIFKADPLRPITTEGLTEQTQKLTNLRYKIGRLMARFPGNQPIGIFDETVDKSLPALRSLGRLIYPKAFSEYLAEAYRQSAPEDRVLLLRGLYTQIMHAMALHGTEHGQQLMENILRDHFGDNVGYLNKSEIAVPSHLAEDVRSTGINGEKSAEDSKGLFTYYRGGPIHNYQPTTVISNLPWGALSDYGLYIGKNGWKREVFQSAGAHTARKFSRAGVNQWAWLTLFPRLGIRASLDEAMFYTLSAQGQDLLRWGLGKKIGAIVSAYTGDVASIPPIKRKMLDVLNKFSEEETRNPLKVLSPEQRVKEIEVNGEQRFVLDDKENIVKNLQNYMQAVLPKGKAVIVDGKETYPRQEKLIDFINQLLIHTDGAFSNALVNASIGKSNIDLARNGDFAVDLTSRSAVTRALKDAGFISTGKYDIMDTEALNNIHESFVALAHYKNWFLRFLRNGENYGPKGSGSKYWFNPAEIFFKYDGMRAPGSLTKVVNDSLEKLGVNTEKMEVENPEVLERFLRGSSQWSIDKAAGVTPIQSAINRLEAMFLDLHDTFHGGADKFNHDLFDRIMSDAKSIREESIAKVNGVPTVSMGSAVRQALKLVNFEDFNKLSKFNLPEGKINTDLHFAKGDDNASYVQKMLHWGKHAPDQAMEWMDAQNQHMFRQPAMWIGYIKYRERYAKLEQDLVQDYINKNNWSPEFAKQMAEKKFTEIALNHASEMVLKSCNNPEVRSNLAWALRTSGRFYRSVEDFYRRVWRLKDATPQLIYRMRLAHMGLPASGFIHNDQNGDPYLVMPADNIIFQAVNLPSQLLGINMAQPKFDDFAMNLTLSNPTLGQDAGMPSLQGPFMGVSVMGVQKLLSSFGGEWGREAATNIDKAVLGNINQNVNWQKAIVPTSLQRAWDMLSLDEKSRQFTSAAMAAIAFNSAHGLGLTPEQVNALPAAERATKIANYMNKVRISAHNVLFLRSLLGFISPIAPTLQESTDVPNYLKNVGVTGLRPEFTDILQNIMKTAGGTIQDPYSAALMAFTAKYPGRIVYTVARTNRTTTMAINYTKEMQNWLAKYKPVIDSKYGDAALVFAPHIGEFDASSYAWLEGTGLLQSRTIDDYYREIAIASDRQQYYDYRAKEQAILNDPNTTFAEKQYAQMDAKQLMDGLKLKNPYLEIALNNKSYGVGKQEEMLNNLSDILAHNDIPMTEGTRTKMSLAAEQVIKAVQDIKAINQQSYGFADTTAKQARKQAVLSFIRTLGGATGAKTPGDPVIQEALKSIFIPVLDYYVRNPGTVQIGQ
jgi:gas vesicle protein